MSQLAKACSVLAILLLCTLSLSVAEDVIDGKVPYVCEDNLIEILFAPESEVRLRDGNIVDLKSNALDGVSAVLGKSTAVWNRLIGLPEERVDELNRAGRTKSGNDLYNLNNAYRLEIAKGQDVWAVSRQLEALPGVMMARPVPKPMALPIPPNYVPLQGYLDSALAMPAGIGAWYAWNNLPGGAGAGVTVCDLEYGWNFSHQDIMQASGSQINPNPIALPTGFTDDHGTAVIGELFSDPNGWGTTGICHGAMALTCGTYYGATPSWNVAGAIMYAVGSMSAGDIILLEQQWDYNSAGAYIPIEWWLDYSPNPQSYNSVYIAIQTAVANGIHVVEAGGNGSINTDGLSWYGNSGAVIVGAGGATAGIGTDRQRLAFSSYGSRFDLQGWGENVVTTGYGTFYNTDGKNYWYTNTFNGTSSASPCVAGAMADCIGFWNGLGWNPMWLSPSTLRNALVTTGRPQDLSVTGNIGPRPDIRAACSLLALTEIEWQEITAPPIDNGAIPAFGVAWGDYNNDGLEDVFVANYNFPNKLYMNMGAGMFADVTPIGLADPGPGRMASWADFDNDGDLDLYLANDGLPNFLYRNDGGGVFTDITTPPLDEPGFTQAAVWGDYDNDGFVDLFLANFNSPDRLLQNLNGTGNFIDVAMPPINNPGPSTGAVWGDYDNDGDLDLYLLQDNTGVNILARNDGGGIFFDMTGMTPLGIMDYSVGAEWIDFDNDAILDMYVVNNGQANALFKGTGSNFLPYYIPQLADTTFNFGTACHDFDNDGDIDFYFTDSYYRNEYVRNDGSFTFTSHTTGKIGCPNDFSLAVGGADIDLDGDVDLYVAEGGIINPNRLFNNIINSGNNWLHIKLQGTTSNKAGIGARIDLFYAAGLRQIREISGGSGFATQNSLTAEFGLGAVMQADSIIVHWPSGTVQQLAATSANKILVLVEPGGIVYMCGDSNNDGSLNVGDAVFLVNYIFKGGPAPSPMCQADANGDGGINIGDAVYLISYIFKGGPAPTLTCCP
ncbi:MAG: FG-GAP-like repeat-containing protein [Candidatus Zixiibacteriota bacterium]